MKKLILLTACLATVSAYALPTYEPFTEFASQVAANPTNAIDLCSNGLTAPSGEVWGGLNFSALTGAAGTQLKGHDVVVTNFSGLTGTNNPFNQTALSALLPAAFPGMPAPGGAINTVLMNPAQSNAVTTNVGNSAVLIFASDITRPATGASNLYFSYLISFAANGQLGGGNEGRYLDLLAQSNLFEPSVGYANWLAMFNQFGNNKADYISHGVLQKANSGNNISGAAYIGPCDSSAGKEFSATAPFVPAAVAMSPTNAGAPPAAAAFIVGNYVLGSSSSADVNQMWVNPSTASFGGATPPAGAEVMTNPPVGYHPSDIAGICFENRVGSGASGGVPTNYVANLIIGSTWSYVTGGPEFTSQPVAATVTGPGTTVTLTSVAVAAGQTVSYQWQLNGANVNNGANGTGSGNATVSGATNSSMTLTGVSAGDSGTYTLIATASGTAYTLTSSNSILTVSDPGILFQPQPTTGNFGGSASFTATAVTATAKLSYAWYVGSTMIANGAQPDGSFAIGSQGTNSGGTTSLTLVMTNISCSDNGSYSLVVTNLSGSTAASQGASLTVADPYITAQPPAAVEVAAGGTATIPIVAGGSGATYAWNWNNGNGANVNNGEISGANTSALTISPATANDAGTYSVTITGTGCGSNVTSSNAVVSFDTAVTSETVMPGQLVQQVGTHLALVGTVNGGSGLVNFVWQHNGTTVMNGLQADGSTIYGANAQLPAGTAISPLVLSNIQVADSGTYTLIASNAAGTLNTGSAVVQVVRPGRLTLSSNNLVVSRVGDGAEPLSGATGNTLYLDQFTTSGVYSNTIMVPDTGPSAIIVAGAPVASGNEGAQEGYITLSSNRQFLNFGGFCYSYPYTGGADVTAGGTFNVRGIYALNAFGTMVEVYTNFGLYSGAHGFRSVYSTDGLTNFWTAGSASGGTVKYVNAGPAGAPYTITTPGSGIPALGADNTGGVVVGQVGANLAFTDNANDGGGSAYQGLDDFTGMPMASTTATSQILSGGVGTPADFAVSPDLNTIYVADEGMTSGSSGNGGVQRWDLVGGTYQYSYNMYDTTSPLGAGSTNGVRGLTVDFSAHTTWGSGVTGAILYGTTSETTGNRIIQITDDGTHNGANSVSTLLVTAATNEFFRGIRFGPISVPLSVTALASTNTATAGQEVDFSAGAQGVFSYYFPNTAGTGYNLISVPPTTYQWYLNGTPISGASNFTYTIPTVAASNAGTYTFVASNNLSTPATNTPAIVLTVNPFGVSSNLVGWFKLSDGSGTNAADSSVYGNTGALYNFPGDNSEWVAGLGSADALNFGNVDTNLDNTVVVPDAPQLNFTNNLEFTLACWINPATNFAAELASNTNGVGAALIAKGYGNGGEQYDLDLYSGAVRFFVRNSSGGVSTIVSSFSPPSNQWTHVAGTYDGSGGTMALYTNGVLCATNTAPGSLLYSTEPLTIGNRTSGSNTTYNLPFFGEIQDARIYNVSLGQADIQAIESVLAPPATPNPVTYVSPVVTGQPGAPVLHFKGTAGGTYHVWTTTNLALHPVETTWTLLGTGTFSGGNDSFTCPSGAATAQFYTITQP